MSESPQYEAFRAFARAEIKLQVLQATQPLHEEIRSLRTQLETRAVEPKVIEGPPGKDGKDGRDGIDGVTGKDGADGKPGERGADGIIGHDGKDGLNGKDGAPGEKGERGVDGIATREELNLLTEERFSELQVRTFADTYQGIYENGKTYTRGVLATWGGSLFLSKTETKAKPGESADWQLVVKRGSDGKDVGARR